MIKDLMALIGLAGIGWGCWAVAPPLAGAVIGTLLLAGAVYSQLRTTKEPQTRKG